MEINLLDTFDTPIFVLGLKGNTPCMAVVNQKELVGLLPVHISAYTAILFDWYINKIPEEYQNATEQRLLDMINHSIQNRHKYTNTI